MNQYEIAIIGSGPAGLTAGIYAARGNAKTVIIEGDDQGGQLMYTQSIENYPGFVTTGPNLISEMRKQVSESGGTFIQEHITKINHTDNHFILHGKRGSIQAKSVIIATGSNAKWLDVPGASKFQGNGISTCATCDGFAYKNKTVAILGGGNTAVEDAIYLSKLCTKVLLIHRRDTLRAEQILQTRLFALNNIEYHWNNIITSIADTDEFSGVILQNTITQETKVIEIDGLFVAIGHTPNTAFLSDLLPLTADGYINANPLPSHLQNQYDSIKSVHTHIPGLFVAGDVMDPTDRQAITAAGYGCMAARRALHYIM